MTAKIGGPHRREGLIHRPLIISALLTENGHVLINQRLDLMPVQTAVRGEARRASLCGFRGRNPQPRSERSRPGREARAALARDWPNSRSVRFFMRNHCIERSEPNCDGTYRRATGASRMHRGAALVP